MILPPMAQRVPKRLPGNDDQPLLDDGDLFYADVTALTIRRRRQGQGWRYYREEDGQQIRDPVEIDRLNRIALPPAYTDARFCADPNGHLQAIGTDARGRRQ